MAQKKRKYRSRALSQRGYWPKTTAPTGGAAPPAFSYRQLAAAWHESEERYRQLVEVSPDAILVHRDGILVFVNSAAIKLLGATEPLQLVGRAMLDFLHPAYHEVAQQRWRQARNGTSLPLIEQKLIRLDGQLVEVETAAMPFTYQGQPAVQAVIRDITQRKRAEETLWRSEKRYRHLVEHSQGLICTHDLAGTLLSVNPASARQLGYVPLEMVGRNMAEFAPAEARPLVAVYLEQIRQQPVVSGLLRLLTSAGEERIWSYQNSRFEEPGQPPYVLGHAQDVTDLIHAKAALRRAHDELEQRVHDRNLALASANQVLRIEIAERKMAQEALRQSEEYFRSLIEYSSDIITILGTDGHIRYQSPALEHVLGYTPEELLGQNIFDYLHSEDAPILVNLLMTVLERQQLPTALEFRFRHRNGTWRILEAKGNNLPEHASIGGIVITSRDVTERKQIEAALQQSERDYHGLFENAHDAILILDPVTEEVRQVNQRACQLYGFTPAEFIGLSMRAIAVNAATTDQLKGELIAHQASTITFETVQYRKDGSEIILEANATLINYQGQLAVLSINRDITERKRAEAARGQLLRRIVTAQEEERRRVSRELHDQIGQHLTALGLGLRSLHDLCAASPQLAERVEQLQGLNDQLMQEAHHLARELRPSVLDDFGLIAALKRYITEWSERSHITADYHGLDLDDERLSPPIETTLYRIVQEALTNIVKHAQARHVSVLLKRLPRAILAIIEDDGKGFNLEAILRTPQAERRLGLLGMQERVGLVEGTLNIESTPGVGTTIFIRIPLSPPEESHA